MQLSDYLQAPVVKNLPTLLPERQTLKLGLKVLDEGIHQTDVALIGIPEDGNSLYNKGCANAPDIIRSHLYTLSSDFSNLYVSDLGNIRHEKGLNNTYAALQQVVEHCVANRVIPILIGGSHDLTLPVFRALEKLKKQLNIACIDSTIDRNNPEDVHDHSFLAHIAASPALANLGIAGFQGYQSSLPDDWELYRLKEVRQAPSVVEPLLRDADLVSMDMAAVAAAYSPGNAIASPNGLQPEHFCKLAQYAGFSDRIACFGVFGANPAINASQQTEKLAAQAIWHFLDGLNSRYKDYPLRNIESYSKKIVHQRDIDRGIAFYHNLQNNRWWFNAGTDTEPYIVACSLEDYLETQEGKLPARLIRFLR